MSLHNYLVRLETLIYSRKDIVLEELVVRPLRKGIVFQGRLRFHDRSVLHVYEYLLKGEGRSFHRDYYKYHYQNEKGELIFRYDNSRHYPHLETFPNHKHGKRGVSAAAPPNLQEILNLIDELIYGN